ncbi:apolipoprotein N-acyltransferase [Agitococcus lubricus]|uniref:Apolipoprotein N-acyltransferase n=1 Tax=Agitococcus lubricus TaxID=1077255 RepID=A0A2T5J1V1_9GAMM|nr:apolipoprotein N-acyltransferase [Agitococcus lubricus]PTQ90414.1 apolipoprotein N-acyltransferase [Agitococcus lubricus]
MKTLLIRLQNAPWAWLVALLLGAITPFSLAPYHYWFISLLTIPLFAELLTGQTTKQAVLRGWSFGFGLWASGVWWLFVSLHDYGQTPTWLAALMVMAVALIMGAFTAVMAYVYRRWAFDQHALLSFAPLFVLFEWLKTWLFTGFPWLFVGYGYIDSVLVGYAPLVGVFGLSLLAIISGQCLLSILKYRQYAWSAALLVLSIWGAGFALQYQTWVSNNPQQPLSVSIIQGNIPQDVKWQLEWRDKTLAIYKSLSASEWGQNLVIWPEAAIPMFQYEANDFLHEINDLATQHGSAFVTGIPYADLSQLNAEGIPPFYNSMAALGVGEGLYWKQRLVPFGEYIPFEAILRGTIPFFSRDMSSFSAGNHQQAPLTVQNYRLGAAICYEIAYPELTRHNAKQADFLATLSNDGWFGHSTGPHQHLQMVQMRALETGKWIIRATNNGISGLIDPHGHIRYRAPQFERTVLRGTIYGVQGQTPFSRLGNWPILIVSFSLLAIATWRNYRRKHQITPTTLIT